MNFKITIIHIWNKLRLYLSLLLFAFYLVIGILFLFSDTWVDFLPDGRGIIGTALILFGILRFFLAYRRYRNKHKHIKLKSSENKKQIMEESQNAKIKVE